VTVTPAGRPELPPDAGISSRRLDLETTRAELALTLDQLFAKFNLRLLLRSSPVIAGLIFIATAGAATAVVVGLLRMRQRRG
jgi:hypothetical protein